MSISGGYFIEPGIPFREIRKMVRYRKNSPELAIINAVKYRHRIKPGLMPNLACSKDSADVLRKIWTIWGFNH